MDVFGTVPDWVRYAQALASVVTAAVAFVAAIVGWRTLRQRTRADAREHWWERTSWAVEKSLSDHQLTYLVGLAVLEEQAASTLMEDEEYRLITRVRERITAGVSSDGDTAEGVEYVVGDDGGDVDEHDVK